MNLFKKWDGILLYIAMFLGIFVLRTVAEYPEKMCDFAQNICDFFTIISEYLGLSGIMMTLQKVPIKYILALVGGVQILFGFMVLLIFRKQMEQGTMILLYEWNHVLKSGTVLYFMSVTCIGVFLYSVIGIPIGVGILSGLQFFVLIGRIPMAIFLGYLLMERLAIRGYTFLYFFLGSFIMLFFESVYALGAAFLFFVFPVFALGTLFCMFINRYYLKMNYSVSFTSISKKTGFDRKKIKEIITKDL